MEAENQTPETIEPTVTREPAPPTHTLPTKIDGMVVEGEKGLLQAYPTTLTIENALVVLQGARERKAAFKEDPAVDAVLTRKKELDEAEREARRAVYSVLASTLLTAETDMQTLSDALPDGLGVAPKYEVHGNKEEIRAWCRQEAPNFLEVNFGLFDEFVKRIAPKSEYPDGAAAFITRPTMPPPAKVVQCSLPTISKDLPLLEDDGDLSTLDFDSIEEIPFGDDGGLGIPDALAKKNALDESPTGE